MFDCVNTLQLFVALESARLCGIFDLGHPFYAWSFVTTWYFTIASEALMSSQFLYDSEFSTRRILLDHFKFDSSSCFYDLLTISRFVVNPFRDQRDCRGSNIQTVSKGNLQSCSMSELHVYHDKRGVVK